MIAGNGAIKNGVGMDLFLLLTWPLIIVGLFKAWDTLQYWRGKKPRDIRGDK